MTWSSWSDSILSNCLSSPSSPPSDSVSVLSFRLAESLRFFFFLSSSLSSSPSSSSYAYAPSPSLSLSPSPSLSSYSYSSIFSRLSSFRKPAFRFFALIARLSQSFNILRITSPPLAKFQYTTYYVTTSLLHSRTASLFAAYFEILATLPLCPICALPRTCTRTHARNTFALFALRSTSKAQWHQQHVATWLRLGRRSMVVG
mmetsp:Transcript_40707/g.105679  ORF Transcript_40707/g.105679 Transcript_40707/m.105679 type:complete len:202 (+) Transcript_40707:357-962(+)